MDEVEDGTFLEGLLLLELPLLSGGVLGAVFVFGHDEEYGNSVCLLFECFRGVRRKDSSDMQTGGPV